MYVKAIKYPAPIRIRKLLKSARNAIGRLCSETIESSKFLPDAQSSFAD
jgi:hypothetical protein